MDEQCAHNLVCWNDTDSKHRGTQPKITVWFGVSENEQMTTPSWSLIRYQETHSRSIIFRLLHQWQLFDHRVLRPSDELAKYGALSRSSPWTWKGTSRVWSGSKGVRVCWQSRSHFLTTADCTPENLCLHMIVEYCSLCSKFWCICLRFPRLFSRRPMQVFHAYEVTTWQPWLPLGDG